MKVLIACEESQRECIEFRKLGHEAFSCDILPCSGGHPEWHIQDDVLKLINGNCKFKTMDGGGYEVTGKWDLIIAHPPCTYLTNAGAARMFRKEYKEYPSFGTFQMVNVERLKKSILARDFFMEFLKADCKKIAVENPVPMKICMMPLSSQTIQPYLFGDPYLKKTYLWLKGLPNLIPTKIVKPICSWVSGGSKKADGSSRENKGMTFRDSNRKSKSFPGIAKAMAEQWGTEGNNLFELLEKCGEGNEKKQFKC